LSSRRPIKG